MYGQISMSVMAGMLKNKYKIANIKIKQIHKGIHRQKKCKDKREEAGTE